MTLWQRSMLLRISLYRLKAGKVTNNIFYENKRFTKIYQRNLNSWPHCQGWNQPWMYTGQAQGIWGFSGTRILCTEAEAVLKIVFKSHNFPLKQKHQESTQASDVTLASKTITGILPQPRFHQAGMNNQPAIFPVSRSRRRCHQRSWQTVMSLTVDIPSEDSSSTTGLALLIPLVKHIY